MSKSYGKPNGVIGLLDSNDTINKKVKKAVTDSLGAITVDPDQRPGVYNLLLLYSAVSEKEFSEVCGMFDARNVVRLKVELAECLVEKLGPTRDRAMELIQDRCYIDSVLADGADKAREIAEANLDDIYEIVGLK